MGTPERLAPLMEFPGSSPRIAANARTTTKSPLQLPIFSIEQKVQRSIMAMDITHSLIVHVLLCMSIVHVVSFLSFKVMM
jgi:hypothetical protein